MKLEPADFGTLTPDAWPLSEEAASMSVEARELISCLEPGVELRAVYSLDDFHGDSPLRVYPVERSRAWSIVGRICSSSDDTTWMRLDDDDEGVFSGVILNPAGLGAGWNPVLVRSGLERFLDGFGSTDDASITAAAGLTVLDDPLLRAFASGVRSEIAAGGDLTIDERYVADSNRRVIRSVSCMTAAASEYLSRARQPNRIRLLLTFDRQFLLSLSKARALRVLASHVMKTYGLDDKSLEIWGFVPGGPSGVDRATHQIHLTMGCAAAILGSCDRIVAEPFAGADGVDADSLRLAINVPRILRYESRLGEVEDAVRGAYYVEALTGRIVQQSWEAFLTIEDMGGLQAVGGSVALDDLLERIAGGGG